MENKEVVKKLEGFEEELEHGISPCDLENNDCSQIMLNKKDALELKKIIRISLKTVAMILTCDRCSLEKKISS